MFEEIFICSQLTAEELEPSEYWGVVSIRGPDKRVALQTGWGSMHIMEFNDLTKPYAGFKCFDEDLAHRLIAHLDDIVSGDQIKSLVVHCEQGRSRSQAVGMFVHEHYAPYLDAPVGPHGASGFNKYVYNTLLEVYNEL